MDSTSRRCLRVSRYGTKKTPPKANSSTFYFCLFWRAHFVLLDGSFLRRCPYPRTLYTQSQRRTQRPCTQGTPLVMISKATANPFSLTSCISHTIALKTPEHVYISGLGCIEGAPSADPGSLQERQGAQKAKICAGLAERKGPLHQTVTVCAAKLSRVNSLFNLCLNLNLNCLKTYTCAHTRCDSHGAHKSIYQIGAKAA